MKMLCRLKPIIRPHIYSHIALKVNTITYISLSGPLIDEDIADPLATLILALTPRWTLLANLILHVSFSHW